MSSWADYLDRFIRNIESTPERRATLLKAMASTEWFSTAREQFKHGASERRIHDYLSLSVSQALSNLKSKGLL